MDDAELVATRFEAHRSRLRSVAYRMLGSLSDADDAVQEAWLRLHRTDAATIDNFGGWLTTVVGRVCLDMLRQRTARREDPMGAQLPDPVLSRIDGNGPEDQLLPADSVGLALLVVLDTLSPAERLAFVLHDLFGVSFDRIAPIVDRSPGAAMQLASRARRRVHGAAPVPDTDRARQRQVVDAFLTAVRAGDFDALLAVLDPDVVLRADRGAAGPAVHRGAATVAARALGFAHLAQAARPVLVNGAVGLLVAPDGRPHSVLAFTIADGTIAEIDILADPVRLGDLDLPGIDGPGGLDHHTR